ncbi:MAG: DNA-processing protein DprA [Actinobacteria bacterium]|nr:DNA-processing protein DprA [Actinomycetota bacterium]
MKTSPAELIKQYRRHGDDIAAAVNYFLENGRDQPAFELLALNGNGTHKEDKDTNKEPDRILEAIRKLRLGIMCIGDDDYPEDLLNIFIPPPLLYYTGRRLKGSGFNIAIVGSRKCSHYGREVAAYLSRNLSETGITVVSGLALGIDAVAHNEAVKGKGGSIAVLGNGSDIVYPPENKSLYHKIAENGTVLSEFPPGTPPLKTNFPIRNRIISGLCKGVVIIEAGIKSGAMITGGLALRQDREVFAVPGNIFSPGSRGCHRFIKSGAKLIENIDDILDEFKHLFKEDNLLDDETRGKGSFGRQKNNPDTIRDKPELDPLQSKVFEVVGHRPKSFDDISIASGLQVSQLLKILLFLEVKGVIKEYPINHYCRY